MILPPIRDAVRELCEKGTSSLSEILGRIAQISRKPIHLVEVDRDGWGALTAFKAEFEDRINIYFPPQRSSQYKYHCIYHELGHIYLEETQAVTASQGIPDEVLRQAEGALSISCRFIQNNPVEQWVEEFAFELSKLTRAPRPGDPDPFLC